MPKCSSCLKNYDDPTSIELVKNQENRWFTVCRHCLDSGVDVNNITQAQPVDAHALATADAPSIDATISGDPIADAKRLLESLRNLRQSKERVGRARSHERRSVQIKAHFTLARDDTRHEGVVRDFSQGGIRLVTAYPLAKGQIVQFDWNIPLPPAMARLLQSTAEVRRTIKTDNGHYDVGFKFMSRQVEKGANRRRFRRYKCEMRAFYQRNGSEFMSMGRVTDISQGGCQIHLDEQLAKDEVFEVRLIGGGGTRGDLVGHMRVCRVMVREADFETGCAFERMHMEKQPTGHYKIREQESS